MFDEYPDDEDTMLIKTEYVDPLMASQIKTVEHEFLTTFWYEEFFGRNRFSTGGNHDMITWD